MHAVALEIEEFALLLIFSESLGHPGCSSGRSSGCCQGAALFHCIWDCCSTRQHAVSCIPTQQHASLIVRNSNLLYFIDNHILCVVKLLNTHCSVHYSYSLIC